MWLSNGSCILELSAILGPVAAIQVLEDKPSQHRRGREGEWKKNVTMKSNNW